MEISTLELHFSELILIHLTDHLITGDVVEVVTTEGLIIHLEEEEEVVEEEEEAAHLWVVEKSMCHSVDVVRELTEHQAVNLNQKITILLKIKVANLIKLHSKEICKTRCRTCSKLSILSRLKILAKDFSNRCRTFSRTARVEIKMVKMVKNHGE